MKARSMARRRAADGIVKAMAGASAAVGLIALAWITWEILARGAGALNWSFFTRLPTPPGMAGGGLANAILGTALITALATVMGVPVGLLAGVYLAEFGRDGHMGALVRFTSNILMGTPSIIIGVFVYTLLVVTTGHFSAYAGAAALAIIMLPVVARTTDDMLSLVPNALRESALALGAARWRVTLGVVFRAAKQGLLTGVLLAVARVSGETAPLLFTALNSPYWPRSLGQPTANLTVTIFNYAMSPYADWQQMAWGASLLITVGVLLAAVIARMALQQRKA
jgi:phosphate transport system permease protein